MDRKRRILGVFLTVVIFAAPQLGRAESSQRTLSLLNTTDNSGLSLGQYVNPIFLEQLQQVKLFAIQSQGFSLDGYSPESLSAAFERSNTELIAFSFIDKERVALFLFDVNRPGRYIATSQTLIGSPTNRITEAWLTRQIGLAFKEMLAQYTVANFELIPATEGDTELSKGPEVSRQERGRRLFAEMSKLQDGAMYVGANVGIARFAAQGASASTISVGGYFGVKAHSRLRFEAGADVFSYLLLHGDFRFQLPIAERYITISVGGTGNYVAAVVTQNRGFNPTLLPTGQFLFGPTLSFDIPLLGASLRGDLRLLLGSSSIFLGTYGLAYTL